MLKESLTQRDFVRASPGAAKFPAAPARPAAKLAFPTNRLNAIRTATPGWQIVAAPAGTTLALLAFYIFLHTSFAGEILKVYLHVPFPVVGIFAVLVPLVVLFAGGAMRFLGTPMAIPWLLFNVWIAISAVLGFYPKDSFSQMVPFELRLQILPLLICAVATTSKSVRTVLAVAAVGVIPVLGLAATVGRLQAREGGRFGIPETSLSNPNDLAFHLLWGSMLLLTFLLRKGKLGRILAAIAIPASVWFILKTASRANFLTLFAVVAIGFVIAAPSIRILLLITVPIGLGVTLLLLPKSTLDRITAVEVSTSIDEVGQEGKQATDAQERGALDSQAARMNLAKLAFTATLRNPVFGSGMGMFADETADYIQRTTRNKAPWQTAHNSYLKVSSENGIPAFLFYVWSILAAIFVTWRSVRQTRKRPGFEDANRNSICILLALAVYAFGTFFCDIVYLPYLAITIGLAAANYLAFRNEDLLAGMASQGPLVR